MKISPNYWVVHILEEVKMMESMMEIKFLVCFETMEMEIEVKLLLMMQITLLFLQ